MIIKVTKKIGVNPKLINVTVKNNMLHVVGTIPLPNPCYEIKANMEIDEKKREIRIHIKRIKTSKICIQVLATAFIEINTEVKLLSNSWQIRVFLDGKEESNKFLSLQ